MLKFFGDDEDTIAFVIGHEMWHLAKGHLQEKRVRDSVIDLIGWVAGLALDYGLSRKTGTVSNADEIWERLPEL